MNLNPHTFDWDGFKFYIKAVAICLIFGTSGHYGLTYTKTYLTPIEPKQVVINKTPSPVSLAITQKTNVVAKRSISSLSITDAIPKEGKFITADLVSMKISLYKDGLLIDEYPIITKGRPGTPWETPSGFYNIESKEETHFSTIGKVYMPYSMQFYGNYFIHGWTYYPDGTPVSASFSGGCIKLSTEDAKKVFTFAGIGTKIFVYDSKKEVNPPQLTIKYIEKPNISGNAYLIVDMNTGDVYAEKNAQKIYSTASLTKLMTALVTNETISFDKKLSVPQGSLARPPDPNDISKKTFAVGELLYPLLMHSSDEIANSFSSFYGKQGFLDWMNTTAKALNMNSTTYQDETSISTKNISNTEDIYRLIVYLANKKSFVLNILNTKNKIIVAEDGSEYRIENIHTSNKSDVQKNETVSILSFKIGENVHKIAVIVLNSYDASEDTKNLSKWIAKAIEQKVSQTACVSCIKVPPYRKIEL